MRETVISGFNLGVHMVRIAEELEKFISGYNVDLNVEEEKAIEKTCDKNSLKVQFIQHRIKQLEDLLKCHRKIEESLFDMLGAITNPPIMRTIEVLDKEPNVYIIRIPNHFAVAKLQHIIASTEYKILNIKFLDKCYKVSLLISMDFDTAENEIMDIYNAVDNWIAVERKENT